MFEIKCLSKIRMSLYAQLISLCLKAWQRCWAKGFTISGSCWRIPFWSPWGTVPTTGCCSCCWPSTRGTSPPSRAWGAPGAHNPTCWQRKPSYGRRSDCSASWRSILLANYYFFFFFFFFLKVRRLFFFF